MSQGSISRGDSLGPTTALLPFASPDLLSAISDGLEQVDRLLREVVDHEDPFIAQASGHLLDAGGKRFRPQLSLLVAQLGTGVTPEVVRAGAAVELVHLASLYHDDVMDEAILRRGVSSANARYGNSTAIVVGDLLFGKASLLTADLGPFAVRIQSETFVRLCSGQLRDDQPVPPGVDPVTHLLGVLADKTGSLIATSARYGAMFSGLDEDTTELLARYGQGLGTVFQLADDLLDISSQTEESGKPAGADLREGKSTLPMLYARASKDPGSSRLRELLSGPVPPEHLREALDLLRAHPAMEQAREHTRRLAQETVATLEPLGDGEVPQVLRALVEGVIERTA